MEEDEDSIGKITTKGEMIFFTTMVVLPVSDRQLLFLAV